MRVEILCTGDEILTGKTVNTNYSHISRRLVDVGLGVHWGTTVGDDFPALVDDGEDVPPGFFGNGGFQLGEGGVVVQGTWDFADHQLEKVGLQIAEEQEGGGAGGGEGQRDTEGEGCGVHGCISLGVDLYALRRREDNSRNRTQA